MAYVGKTFFDEETFEHSPKPIENRFGSEFTYLENCTPWLEHATDDVGEFERIPGAAEEVNITDWALPEPFLQEWEKRAASGKAMPKLDAGSHGPATIIMSVLNPKLAVYWMYDQPGTMRRFTALLGGGAKIVELNETLREFSDNYESVGKIALATSTVSTIK